MDEEEPKGVRGLLEDPKHIRSDLQLIERYGDDFSEEELGKLRRRLGEIIISGSDREAIRAMQVELKRVQLMHELEQAKKGTTHTHTHAHLHVENKVDEGRSSVFEVAESLGIEIDIVEDDGEVIDGTVSDGEEAGPDQRP